MNIFFDFVQGNNNNLLFISFQDLVLTQRRKDFRKDRKEILIKIQNIYIMTENELSKIVFDLGMKVHKSLGPGLLESVYEECFFTN